ncbi:hypothetical protein EAF04_010480 [Stromatinia cepivora]|nr:hypothetical protein EAF04_010480 [Stromatinia cepivora]
MVSLKVAWKERDWKPNVPFKKSGSNLLRYPKWLSKIKIGVKKKKVPFGPKTWVECWKDVAPVISASEEFYGLPETVIFMIWTCVLESDFEPQTYQVKPSLIENVFHARDKQINMTGARALLQVNRLTRELALERFGGNIPIFAGQDKPPGILRFDAKEDTIYIKDFRIVAFQMTVSASDCLWRIDKTQCRVEKQVQECLEFYPKYYQIAKLRWMNKMPKRIRRHQYCFKSDCRDLRRCLLVNHELEENEIGLPTQTWNLSQSIQNLAVDYEYFEMSEISVDWTMCRDHSDHQHRANLLDLLRKNGIQTLGVENRRYIHHNYTFNISEDDIL